VTAANATAACHLCIAKVTVSYQTQYPLNDGAADEYYCNGGCYPVTCGTLAMLSGADPTILLSAEAKDALDSSLDMVLTYATPVAFNLLPCPSTGRPCHQAQHLSSPVCHAASYLEHCHSTPLKASWLPNHCDLYPTCIAHQQSRSVCCLSSNALGNLIHRHSTPPDCHWNSCACILVSIGVLGC
jgi:hypothetical protein